MKIYAMGIGKPTDLPRIEGIYLHGILQDISGYDLVVAEDETKQTIENMDAGIYPVTVWINNNWFHANLYYWYHFYPSTNTRRHRGYIVAINDDSAKQFARNKFIKREVII